MISRYLKHLASHASNFPSFLRKSLAWAWAFIWLTLAMWNTAKPAQTQHRYLVYPPALEVLNKSYIGNQMQPVLVFSALDASKSGENMKGSCQLHDATIVEHMLNNE